jgi:hypothetical protein
VSSQLDPRLFEFVHDFAADVEKGTVGKLDTVEASSPIIVFCESFFEQFMGDVLGSPITGFDQESKRTAAGIAERLKVDVPGDKATRRVLALFERFCDVHADVVGGTYGAGSITYQRFHADYMRRLLEAGEDWADASGQTALRDVIAAARVAYDKALRAQGW